jgi:hypothetical protein
MGRTQDRQDLGAGGITRPSDAVKSALRGRRGASIVRLAKAEKLARPRGDAAGLLGLPQGHWGIENRLHYVKDETLREDRCRVRTGMAPQVLAAVRNAVVHLLGKVQAPSKPAATRRFAAHPEKALPLLLT